MSDLTDYKCPSCGGRFEFDSASQQMKCPYCDTVCDIETLEKLEEEKQASKGTAWEKTSTESFDNADGVKTFVCSACGGEIIGDDTLVATNCPFCDNPVVIGDKISGELKPDCIIPFKLDKKSAKESLKNFVNSKKFVPKIFKDENHIDEIKGIYVPYWLFKTDANADISFDGEIVERWSDSEYDYKSVDYYKLLREGYMNFENIPIDGSSKIENVITESIEPFYNEELTDFKMPYLSGYLAEKYDVSYEDCTENINSRIYSSVEEYFLTSTNDYKNVTVREKNIELSDAEVKYALYPVWFLNTSWNGETYTFAMNGQTGKFVGSLPLDKTAFWKMVLILWPIFSVIIYFIANFFR